MMNQTVTKIAKNHFKCFHCRLVFAQRDGNWFNWESMQVHLCRTCERLTDKRPERNQKFKRN